MAAALIGLGANLGDRQTTLLAAIGRLAALPDTRVAATSSLVFSAAVGGPAHQPSYLNAVTRLETTLAPAALLAALHDIERALGRRREQPWSARSIDLDLLLYNQQVIDQPDLRVPHPYLAVRRFVLEPASMVAAGWQHPEIGWTISQLFDHLQHAIPYLAVCGTNTPAVEQLASQTAHAGSGIRLLPQPAAEQAIDWIDGCAAMLARDGWPAVSEWSISPFWIGQPLGQCQLSTDERAAIEQHLREVNAAVVPPKVLVVVQCLPSVDTIPPAKILLNQDALEQATHGWHRGPRLVVSTRDRVSPGEQLLAVMAAMR